MDKACLHPNESAIAAKFRIGCNMHLAQTTLSMETLEVEATVVVFLTDIKRENARRLLSSLT